MFNMKKHFMTIMAAALAAVMLFGCTKPEDKTLRLINWNIQNGMWDGQNDNYDRFVNFVKAQDPDVCVWCEAQSIWKTDSDQAMAAEDRYLVHNWGELAARYGHKYWAVGGHRDNYPQVITSKYPINVVSKILGDESDVIVAHGAGWFTIEVNGKTLNIVSLHTWPHAYAYRAEDREASKAEKGGDKYRAKEIQYICEHTIGTVEGAGDQLWMMMGDFNSRSRVDNEQYGYAEDDPKFLVHDYIRANTPYMDVIKEKYPEEFKPTTGSKTSRIDYVYCTKPLYDRIKYADVIRDDYTTPVRDPQKLSNFWRPSDHMPIIIDFDMK
jgi:endonuclease/exonuclease/phosphatase family metal-dependent hydrolase